MNFVEQEFIPKKVDKSKRTTKILMAFIILTIILIVVIICVLLGLRQEPLRISFDGENNKELKSLLQFEEDNKVYIPIRDIAPYYGYESFNGDYINKSEDSDKCYIECDNEVVTFVANSNKIQKINPKTLQTEYYLIDEPVKLIDGKLYTTPNGISEAYNSHFVYDKEKNKITIETMQYIIERYQEKIVEWEFEGLSEEFNDEKATLKGLAIVTDSRKKYGVINVETQKKVLETKYDKISYIPVTGDFMITSNNKVGIKDENGKDKIRTDYDEIDTINQDLKLYVVKQDEKYGVIDNLENSVIPIIFDEIGIENKKFGQNQVTNKYLILDEIIPVKRNEKWALYKIDGTRLTDLKYESIGSTINNIKDAKGVLAVPEYKLIVAQINEKYIFIETNGEEVGNGIEFEQVYMITELDETTFYVSRNKTTVDASKVFDRLFNKNNNNEKENNNDNNNDNNNNSENENNEE